MLQKALYENPVPEELRKDDCLSDEAWGRYWEKFGYRLRKKALEKEGDMWTYIAIATERIGENHIVSRAENRPPNYPQYPTAIRRARNGDCPCRICGVANNGADAGGQVYVSTNWQPGFLASGDERKQAFAAYEELKSMPCRCGE